MNEILLIGIGVVLGFMLAWFWRERVWDEHMSEQRASYNERLDNAANEIAAANADNREIREKLTASEFALQDCGRARAELEARTAELGARIAELEPASEQLATAQARVAELEQDVEQERQRRHELRDEFTRIETQLARHSYPGADGVGPSMALHESPMPFVGQSPDQAPAISDAGTPFRPDDLKQIKGIGPVLEKRLNALGIHTIAQIAELDDANLNRVDAVLNFKGRIQRERWVEQAQAMLG